MHVLKSSSVAEAAREREVICQRCSLLELVGQHAFLCPAPCWVSSTPLTFNLLLLATVCYFILSVSFFHSPSVLNLTGYRWSVKVPQKDDDLTPNQCTFVFCLLRCLGYFPVPDLIIHQIIYCSICLMECSKGTSVSDITPMSPLLISLFTHHSCCFILSIPF